MIKFVDGRYVEMTEEEISLIKVDDDPIEILQNEIERLKEELDSLRGEN